MNSHRSSNSLKNAVIAVIMNIFTIVMGFVSQKIFVITLGKEYLGLNGLFSNVLSILAVVELGFGSAIIYHLYKPVAQNDRKMIKVLMKFYQKIYRIIAFIIFILGLVVMPFLKNIIGEISIKESIYVLFFLALIDIVVSYLLTYKRSILYANQKNYVTNIVHIGYIVFMNIFEIILLLLTHNYFIYLLTKIIFRFLENVIISILANKMYPFILEKNEDELDDEVKKDIFQKVKGLLFHKIGGSLVLGTDNIIISKFIGVVSVGLYSNYNLIINAVSTLFSQIFTSITSVVGNLLIENDSKKSYNIFSKMLFLNSWMYSWAGTCILCLMQPFISLWMGKDYLLPYSVLIVLVINFYIQGMKKTSNTFKEAAGIFYEDRFVPLIESAVNIIVSIILAKKFGLIGVFIGTFLSSMVLFLYSYPIFVYKRLFKRKYTDFLKEHIFYLIISIFVMFITVFVVSKIHIENIVINLLINLIVCMILPNFINLIIFGRRNEFKYYINMTKKTKEKTIKKA